MTSIDTPNSAAAGVEQHSMSLRRVFSYASGDLALNLAWQMTGVFALIFLTDVFGVQARAAGVIFLVSRIWDAICDPLIGWITDHTKSKAGSYRPYLLWGSIPLSVTLVLLFWAPGLTGGAKVAYAAVAFIAFMTSYSLVATPYGALLPTLTRDGRTRSRLASFRFAFAMLGLVVVAAVTPAVVAGAASPVVGYRIAATSFGVVLIGIFVLAYRGTEERFRPERSTSSPLKTSLRAVIVNRPLMVLITALFFLFGDLTVITGSVAYSYTYRFHAAAEVGQFLIVFALSGAVGALAVPRLRRRFEPRAIAVSALTLLAVASVAWLLLPQQPVVALVIAVFDGAGIVGTAACILSMIADAVDYGHAKTGVQAAGLASAAYASVTKLSAAVGGLAIAEMLAASGYVADTAQTPAVLRTMLMTLTAVPAGLAVLAIVALSFYPLTTARMREISAQISDM